MGSQFNNGLNRQVSRLDMEAVSLFGKRLVQQSKELRVEDLAIEAGQVAEGVRQLREQSGRPDRQRAIIEAMDETTALALCKWICEPVCMAGFIARESH